MAPEVVRDPGGQISWRKADIWSLACTTLEMTTGRMPWNQFNNSVTILYHLACQDTFPEYPSNPSTELLTFFNACFQRDPHLRPDVTSLLLHPFVASSSSSWGSNMRPTTVSSAVNNQGNEWDYPYSRNIAANNMYSAIGHRRTASTACDIVSNSSGGITPIPIDMNTRTTASTTVNSSTTASPLVPPQLQLPQHPQSARGGSRNNGQTNVQTANLLRETHPMCARHPSSSRIDYETDNTIRMHVNQIGVGAITMVEDRTVPTHLSTSATFVYYDPDPENTHERVEEGSIHSLEGTHTLDHESQILPNQIESANISLIEDDDMSINRAPPTLLHPHPRRELVSSPMQADLEEINTPYRSTFNSVESSNNQSKQNKKPSKKNSSNVRKGNPSNLSIQVPTEENSLGMNMAGSKSKRHAGSSSKAKSVDNASGNISTSKPSTAMTSLDVKGISTTNTNTTIVGTNGKKTSSTNSRRSPNHPSFPIAEPKLNTINKLAQPSKLSASSVSTNSNTNTFNQQQMASMELSNQKALYDEDDASSCLTPRAVVNETDGDSLLYADDELGSMDGGATDNMSYGTVGGGGGGGGGDTSRPMPAVTLPANLESPRISSRVQLNPIDMSQISYKEKQPSGLKMLHAKKRDESNFYQQNPKSSSLFYTTSTWEEKVDDESYNFDLLPAMEVEDDHAKLILESVEKMPMLPYPPPGSGGNMYGSDHRSSRTDLYEENNDNNLGIEVKDDDFYSDAKYNEIDYDGRPGVISPPNTISVSSSSMPNSAVPTFMSGPNSITNHNNTMPMIVPPTITSPIQRSFKNPRFGNTSKQLEVINGSSNAAGKGQFNSSNTPYNNVKNMNNVASASTKGKSRRNERKEINNNNNNNAANTSFVLDNSNEMLEISCDSLESLHISGFNAISQSSYGHNNNLSLLKTTSYDGNNPNPFPTSTVNTANVVNPNRMMTATHDGRKSFTNLALESMEGELSMDLKEAAIAAVPGNGKGTVDFVPLSLTEILRNTEPTTFSDHTGAITRLRAPRKQSQLLFSASVDGTVRMWSMDDSGEPQSYCKAVFSADGLSAQFPSLPASATSVGKLNRAIANQTTNNTMGDFVTGGDVGSVASLDQDNGSISNLGTAGMPTSSSSTSTSKVKITDIWTEDHCENIWSVCSDGMIRVWQVNQQSTDTSAANSSGRPLRLLKGHEDNITSLAGLDPNAFSASLSSSSTVIATGSMDRTIRIWDIRAKKSQIFVLRGHGDSVLSLTWSEEGRALISGSKDKMIKIWDTRAGRLRSTSEKHFGSVHSIRSLADYYQLLGISSGKLQQGTSGASGEAISSSASSSSSSLAFLSAGRDAMLNFWNYSGDCISSQNAHRGHIAYLSPVCTSFSRASASINTPYSCYGQGLPAPMVVSVGTDNVLKVWDLKRIRCCAEISVALSGMNVQGIGNINKVCWTSPTSFVSTSTTGAIKLFEKDSLPHPYTAVATATAPPTAALSSTSAADNHDWKLHDLKYHHSACTDVVSNESFLSVGAKNGRILRWQYNVSG
jgi:WD40 repeat protein